jgi:predicted CopG family antitoxin
MKTIEVTDEQYEFLKEAKHLLNTQDNRCTRDPIYCIMEKKRIYGLSEDYSSDYVWARDDIEFKTIKNLFEE